MLGEFLVRRFGNSVFLWETAACLCVWAAVPGIQRFLRSRIRTPEWRAGSVRKKKKEAVPGAGAGRVRGRRPGGKSAFGAAVLFSACLLAGSLRYAAASRPDALERRIASDPDEKVMAEVTGWISDMVRTDAGWRVYLRGTSVTADGVRYTTEGVIWQASDRPEQAVGSPVWLSGTAGFYSRSTNPGCFDLRDYYRSQGYRVRLQNAEAREGSGPAILPLRWIWELRQILHGGIENAADSDDAGMLEAMFLGESAQAPDEQKDLFRQAGIAHLLAVSGLHILFAGMAVYRLVRRLTGSFAAAGAAGSLVSVIYGFLTGNSVSALRAVLMFCVMAAAGPRGRCYDTATACGAAAAVTALAAPLRTATSSFLLSYSAVFGMSVLADGWKAWLVRGEKSRLLTLLAMQHAMLPFTLWYYYEFPPYALLLNQLILPFSGWLLGCAAGCAVSGLGGFLRPAAGFFRAVSHGILLYYKALCGLFSRLPGSVRVTGRPAEWRMFTVFAAEAVFLLASRCARKRIKRTNPADIPAAAKRKRTAAAAAAAFAVYFAIGLFLRADSPDGLRVTMIDVGQGDSVLIEFAGGGSILSDGGSTSQENVGRYVLEPVLQSRGISRLSGILVSHADADHINGVCQMISRGNVTAGWIGIPDLAGAEQSFSLVMETAAEQGIPVVKFSDGMRICSGSTVLRFVHPAAGAEAEDTNSGSLCFALEDGNFTMLFTGDIPSEEEGKLEEFSAAGDAAVSLSLSPDLQPGREGASPGLIDVLKVPHHGSRYSSSAGWLMALSPETALISCGRGNLYGHPHAETLERLADTGAAVYITEETGAVTLTVSPDTYTVSPFFGEPEVYRSE